MCQKGALVDYFNAISDSVESKMFQLKHLLLLGFLSLASGQKSISCSKMLEIFDQTENQYYDLGCAETNEKTSKTLEYQCRVLQKKMDIFGHRYFDFGVSTFMFHPMNFALIFLVLVGLVQMV